MYPWFFAMSLPPWCPLVVFTSPTAALLHQLYKNNQNPWSTGSRYSVSSTKDGTQIMKREEMFVMNTQLDILTTGVSQTNNNPTSRFCWPEQTVKISICWQQHPSINQPCSPAHSWSSLIPNILWIWLNRNSNTPPRVPHVIPNSLWGYRFPGALNTSNLSD